jgi:hypothetical protein
MAMPMERRRAVGRSSLRRQTSDDGEGIGDDAGGNARWLLHCYHNYHASARPPLRLALLTVINTTTTPLKTKHHKQ